MPLNPHLSPNPKIFLLSSLHKNQTVSLQGHRDSHPLIKLFQYGYSDIFSFQSIYQNI